MLNTIEVFHSSYRDFEEISLDKAKEFRDFGKGFYVTEYMPDSLAILKKLNGFLYTYQLNITDDLNILTFETDDDWFEYILKNRLEKIEDTYDIVIGKTASGKCAKLFKEIRYKHTEMNKKDLLDTILTNDYKEQICIKTKKGLQALKLIDKEYIEFQ